MIENTRLRRTLLVLAILFVAGIITVLENSGNKSHVPTDASNLPESEKGLPSAADFSGATGWLNTPDNASLDLVSLRGKVVLVDFWTYSCINCLHSLPHITALYDAYRDHGLVVVGSHSPEFAFETKRANVAQAIARYGIHYPVAQDNDYGIWDAYSNHYWPAHYVVDQYGKIRGSHFGEGGYAETEDQMRMLLTEAGYTDLPHKVEPLPDVSNGDRTCELYVNPRTCDGHSTFGNTEGYTPGQDVQYTFPAQPAPDRIYLDGLWTDGSESATAAHDGDGVQVDFRGAAVNLVAAGPDGACVQVLLDGKPMPSQYAAHDVTVEKTRTCLYLAGSRSYDVYAGPREGHTLELQVPAGFELFTFDFT